MTTPLVEMQGPQAPQGAVRALGAAIGLLLAFSLLGLATTGSAAPRKDEGAVAAVLSAADRTLSGTTGRFKASAQMKVGETTVPVMEMTGVADFATGRGVATLKLSVFTVESRNDGTTSFVRFPSGLPFSGSSQAGPDTWFALENSLLPARDNPLSSLSTPSVGSGQPDATLEMLRSGDQVKRASKRGVADVGGVQTTEYLVVVHGEPMKAAMFRGSSGLPPGEYDNIRVHDPKITLFVDDEGYVRKQVLALRVDGGGRAFGMTATVERSDFGVAVEVPPVPQEQVTRLGSYEELDRLIKGRG